MVVIPALNTAEADAPIVQCAPNMEELIPVFSRINCNHLAIELEVTAFCGLINEMNSFLPSWYRGQLFSSAPEGYSLDRVLCLQKRKGRRKVLPVSLVVSALPEKWIKRTLRLSGTVFFVCPESRG